jgi:nicotinamidase/pyrazinamidase
MNPSKPTEKDEAMPRNNLKIDLLIVDPNNDFMGNDDGSPMTETVMEGGLKNASMADLKCAIATSALNVAALPVKGAVSDAKRLAALVDRVGHKLNDIHVTLDSHHAMHIAHPDMWADENGKQPPPFTIVLADSMKNGIWRARNPAHQKRMYSYLQALEATGKVHCIWPPHCRIGTWGHNIEKTLEVSLTNWERREMGVLDVVTKGSAVFTEHFGGLMAEVVDPNDPSTQLYTPLITTLQDADLIGVAGWASSHCVKRTVEQLAENIGDEHVKKMHLITDCMSPVPAIPGVDFPAIASQFLKDMQARGMTLTTADQFLS